MSHPTPQARLPLPVQIPRTNTIRARVSHLGCGTPPMTCEVVTETGTQMTVWYRGYHIGEWLTLEQRMGATAPYWADIHDCGGPTSVRASR